MKIDLPSSNAKKQFIGIGWLVLFSTLVLTRPHALWATPDPFQDPSPDISMHRSLPSQPWLEEIKSTWGGHLKCMGEVSWPDDESFFKPVGTGTFYDGSTDFRLKNRVFLAEWGVVETHYEMIISGGDTRRKGKALQRLFPGLFKNGRMPDEPLNDDRRLMDLTKTMAEDNSYILYHRLDRFTLTLQPSWGTVRIGRQALTWGNGLLFNPMDLFNPFSPTDIDRDYKIGDDMAFVQFPLANAGDFQFLYVPRRNPVNNHPEFDQSSLAGKLHIASGTTEFDIMAARHFTDRVVGLGVTGYLKDAVWRMDTTVMFLDDSSRNGVLSLVANMDYSWIWWKKNWYGLVEFYYNGLGSNSYSEALTDVDISDRLVRGELFVFGRTYLSGEIQLEIHPLFNLYLTVINNLADPSGIIQPRCIWDLTESIRITAGANLYYGRTGTEFGGFNITGTDLRYAPLNSTFFWMTYFF